MPPGASKLVTFWLNWTVMLVASIFVLLSRTKFTVMKSPLVLLGTSSDV